MSHFQDLSTYTLAASGPHIRAIGWLGSGYEYPKGSTPIEFVERLRVHSQANALFGAMFGFEQFYGAHVCELCNKKRNGGEIGIPDDETLYVAPRMISHYVEEHSYQPPLSFINALMKAPIPGTPEYTAVAKHFWKLNVKNGADDFMYGMFFPDS